MPKGAACSVRQSPNTNPALEHLSNQGWHDIPLPPNKTYKFLCLASDKIRRGFSDDEFDLYTELKSLDPTKEYALIEVR